MNPQLIADLEAARTKVDGLISSLRAIAGVPLDLASEHERGAARILQDHAKEALGKCGGILELFDRAIATERSKA